jgi:hypothetical protein
MRLALMVHGGYPCVRVGKIAAAMNGWTHDALCHAWPQQLEGFYRSIVCDGTMTSKDIGEEIAKHPAEIIHVHNEPNWTVPVAKEYANGRPVILNVHDVGSARPNSDFDPFEAEAFSAADGLVFISEQQREFCKLAHFDVDKPYAVVGNYAHRPSFIDKTPLPHIGGVVYEGGCDARGSKTAWRDQSSIADLIDLHVFTDGAAGYGIHHPTEHVYDMLIHRLAQFDWGYCGTPVPIPAWQHSIPNKFFDYLTAGIPVIALNVPLLKPLCDAGLGVYIERPSDIRQAAKLDPKPYRKAVLAQRDAWTMARHIAPVEALYSRLLGGAK